MDCTEERSEVTVGGARSVNAGAVSAFTRGTENPVQVGCRPNKGANRHCHGLRTRRRRCGNRGRGGLHRKAAW